MDCVVTHSCPPAHPSPAILGPLWDVAVTGPWSFPGGTANNDDLKLTQHASPQGRINVPSSAATFTVGIAYQDDTPGSGQGDYGFYGLEVDECLTNADGAKQGLYLAQDVPSGQSPINAPPSQVGDCTTPGQAPGAWWILQRNAQTLAGSNANLSSSYLSEGTKAARPGQSATGTLSVGVTFPQVNNRVRFQVQSALGSTAVACPNQAFCGWIQPGESETVAPVDVVVFPTALAQLKVLPYTILYAPPGSSSSSAFTTTSTFGTSMTTGSSTELDNSTADDQWLKYGDTDTTNLGLDMGGDGLGINDKLDFSFQDSTRWDNSVQTGAGQTQSAQVATGWQVTTSFGNTLGGGATPDLNQIPGAAGSYQSAPFWSDVIVLLRRPQIALWDFQGQPVEQLMGGLGDPQNGPEWVTVSVRTLDDCATGAKPYSLPPLPPGDPVLPDETLTAQECTAVASLDPFYGKGQSTVVGHGAGEEQAGDRGVWVFGDTYGMPIGAQPSDQASGITQQDITGQWTQAQHTSQTTYNSTVQDIFSSSSTSGDTVGGTVSIFGLSIGGSDNATSSQRETETNSSTLKVNYQTTAQAKFEQDWTVQANIKDTHVGLVNPLTTQPYQPDVEIYQDKSFGALMFRDPGAPGPGQYTRFGDPSICFVCDLGTSP